MSATYEIRPYRDSDRDHVVELLAAILGRERSEQTDDLFDWKHLRNPAGTSIMLVADHGGEVVGFRAMMRWTFRQPGGDLVPAIRAVDTATAAQWQGRGIFSALTLAALDIAADEAVAFVFNTPNDQSRPGYMKLGWREWGRPEVAVIPASVTGLWHAVRSRVPAARESLPLDGDPVSPLPRREASGLATDRTDDWYRWRYENAGYRRFDVGDGEVIARLRQRGLAREFLVVEQSGVSDRSLRRLARQAGASYALRSGRGSRGAVRLPSPPLVTWRPVADQSLTRPPLDLLLADVELF